LDASKRSFSICLIFIVYKWRQCQFITVKYCLFDVATLLLCHESSKKWDCVCVMQRKSWNHCGRKMSW
jgi:hypothetical protein